MKLKMNDVFFCVEDSQRIELMSDDGTESINLEAGDALEVLLMSVRGQASRRNAIPDERKGGTDK